VFAGLINQAKSAASHLVLKYVARASVAVPFVIAAGFALAALTVMLVERFGHVMAYWLVAGGLALIGVIASIAVSVKEHEEEVAEEQAAKTDTEEVVSEATASSGAGVPDPEDQPILAEARQVCICPQQACKGRLGFLGSLTERRSWRSANPAVRAPRR